MQRNKHLYQSRHAGKQSQQCAAGAKELTGKPGKSHTDMEHQQYFAVHTGFGEHFRIAVTGISGKSGYALSKIVGGKNCGGYISL